MNGPHAADDGTSRRSHLVRRATIDDLVPLMRLIGEITAEHGVATPDPLRLRATLLEIMGRRRPDDVAPPADAVPARDAVPAGRPFTDTDHGFLVIEAGGRVAGMCALVFSTSTWSTARVCELQDVVVSSAFRGSGLGHALVEGAVASARAAGCARVFLTAEAFNLPAHGFYRSAGFDEKAVFYFERAT